jgi:DNA-binding NarL/FixJ family response regulator
VTQPTDATIRVLIVDDHEMVAESFRHVLDFEDDIEVVATAGTAAAGVAAAATHMPDVVLMDYALPDESGIEAAKRIRSQLPGVKTVLLTSSEPDTTLPGALEAGCAGYLQKSGALAKLAPAIRAVASGEIAIAAADLGRLVAGSGRSARGVGALTPREREILVLLAEGLTNKAIAERLSLSVHTVRTHVQTVLAKLGAHSKLEAVAVARKGGLLQRP